MEFGIFDHLDRYDVPLHDFYEDRLRLIEAYDRAGFHAYHLAEHHATPLGMAPSPNVFLAAVAQRTKRLRFGPMVYALPLYHPLRLIEEICMLDQLSGGRLELGFGRGASPIEIGYYGQDPAEADRVYGEALGLVLAGLSGPLVDFAGEFFRFEKVPLQLTPAQKPCPPLWYGAHSPESAERAARKGFNIIILDPLDLARRCIDSFCAAWQEERGNAPLPKLGLGRFIFLAETDDKARQIARRAYRQWHQSFTYLFRLLDRSPVRPRPEDFDTLQELGQGVAGSPETVIAFLEDQFRRTRANYLVGQFAFGDLSPAETGASLDLFVGRVMPALRALTPA